MKSKNVRRKEALARRLADLSALEDGRMPSSSEYTPGGARRPRRTLAEKVAAARRDVATLRAKLALAGVAP